MGITVLGIDLAKAVFQLHGNDERVSLAAVQKFTDYLYAVVTDVAGSKK